MIKLKIRSGRHEIEVEGERTDVEAILERYWRPGPPAADCSDADESDGGGMSDGGSVRDAKNGKTARRRRRATSTSADTAGTEASELDHAELANEIKQHVDFATLDRKALHEGKRFERVVAVMWSLDIPLTSGDIAKILHELRLKEPQPRVSEVLSENRRVLLTEKVRRGKNTVDAFRLTGPAATKFEEWLGSNTKTFTLDGSGSVGGAAAGEDREDTDDNS